MLRREMDSGGRLRLLGLLGDESKVHERASERASE